MYKTLHEEERKAKQQWGIDVMARIHIPPYVPYFLVFIPILIIDLRDCALMRYDIVEGFCSYLCSHACEVV
jgi:hypothetical protein